MINLVYCTSDISEADQYYVVSNLGPEIVSFLEQNFLSHQDGEVNDGVLCSQCFDRIIVAMSTVRHSLGHEHNLQHCHDTTVCARCRTSLFGRRAHSLPEGLARDFIAENIAPREIPPGGLVCYACWVSARRNVQRSANVDEMQQRAGQRMMSCCAHIMTIVWYLGWARYQNNIEAPAPFLDGILIRHDLGNEIDE